jgi:hypothetical protein
MKLSIAKPVWVCPTERHQSTGIAVGGECTVTSLAGSADRYGESDTPSIAERSSAAPGRSGCPAMVCRQATIRPDASIPASMRCTNIGRYQPPRRSSARVQTVFTGASAPLATWTASAVKSLSGLARRPNPPPRNVVWMWTFSGARPQISAATPWSPPWNWVPVQTSQRSFSIRTVALSGSIGACRRRCPARGPIPP